MINPEDQLEEYKDLPRNDAGYIMLTDYKPKPKKITLDATLAEPKLKPLSYFDRRKPENKSKFRNHYRFMGMMPDFRRFERIRCKQVISPKHFREQRMLIMIMEFIPPVQLMLELKLVSKKFYMITWHHDVLYQQCFHAFGIDKWDEVKYRIAKRMDRVEQGIVEQPRYFIETDKEETDSDSFSSGNEDGKAHIRNDDHSSGEDENALKQMFRRNAKEEYYKEKDMKRSKEQEAKDLKIIEKCRFNKEPIPEEFKQKYADLIFQKDEFKFVTKKEMIIKQLRRDKLKKREKQRQFYLKYIPAEPLAGQNMKPAAEFKRKVLLFYCLARRCFNCSKIDFSLDIDTEVVIDPVLKKPICYNCKMSEKFRMISATSAGRKYHVDKKDIDMLNLDFFDVPNPYYTAKKMKLYYEYQIVENLPKVQKWRDFKRQKIQASAKVWRDEKKKMRDEKKIHQTLLALEIEFRREHRGAEKALLTRDQIEEKYINDPLMDLYLNEKTKMQLAQIVDLIDEGKSKKYIQRMQEQQERVKLMRTPEGREAIKRLREKEDKKKGKKGKKDKKKKKETKKEKEARIEKERRKEMAKSTISNRHKDVSARNEKEFDKKRREKEQKKIKERMKKLKKKSKVDSSDDDD